MYDYSELRGRIKTVFGRQEDFANAMQMTKASLSNKLNNKTQFQQKEITSACTLLNINKEDVWLYFFTKKQS